MSSTFQAGFAGARSRDREARSTKCLRLRWESNDRVQHEELLQLSCATLPFETMVVQGLGSSHGDLPACTSEATRNSRRAPGAEAPNTGPSRQTFDVCLHHAGVREVKALLKLFLSILPFSSVCIMMC
jgi:hypothetical protein